MLILMQITMLMKLNTNHIPELTMMNIGEEMILGLKMLIKLTIHHLRIANTSGKIIREMDTITIDKDLKDNHDIVMMVHKKGFSGYLNKIVLGDLVVEVTIDLRSTNHGAVVLKEGLVCIKSLGEFIVISMNTTWIKGIETIISTANPQSRCKTTAGTVITLLTTIRSKYLKVDLQCIIMI